MNGFVDDSLKGLWNEFALLGHESRAYPSFVPPPSNLCEKKKKGLSRVWKDYYPAEDPGSVTNSHMEIDNHL